MHIVRMIPGVCLLALLLAASSPAYAQNLLANPHFDTNLSGWGNIGGATFDGTKDANGSLTSGSARWAGTVVFPSGAVNAGVGQCISGIVAGNTYDFGGKILLTSAPAAGNVNVILTFFSDNACSTQLTFATGSAVSTLGSFQSSNGTLLAPAGTQSALVQENEHTAGTAGDFVVNFDDMFLQVGTPVPDMPPLVFIALGLTLFAIGAVVLGGFRLTRTTLPAPRA